MIQRNSLQAARAVAKKIVKKYALNPPIDPRDIFKELNIPVIEEENQLGIEAYTELGEIPKVHINNQITYLPRLNFTLAHELGHQCLSWHNGDIKCNIYTPYILIQGQRMIDIQELEANIFASELLMPTEWINVYIEKYGLDLETLILEIQREANTSVMACFFALEYALPSGFILFVKLNNDEYWRVFKSKSTYTTRIYYDKNDEFQFLDDICEDKREFQIFSYHIKFYKLCPCIDEKSISFLYNSLHCNIYELLNTISDYQPIKTIPFLDVVLNNLHQKYCAVLLKHNKILKIIRREDSVIKFYGLNNYESIKSKIRECSYVEKVLEKGYKLILIEETVFQIPQCNNKNPNLLLRTITSEIYDDSLTMLRKINGVVSSANSANKNTSREELYNIIRHRFAGDPTYVDFYKHQNFNDYLVNKIDSMIKNRKDK